MFFKRLIFLACIVLMPMHVFGLTPMPMNWHSMAANGSSVSFHSKKSATFRIVRKSNGPKDNIDTQGYAYLLSDAIPLPAAWQKIILRGEWWQPSSSKKNYEEMNIFVYGSYPILPHGTQRSEGLKVTNYAEVSYDTCRIY